MSIMLRLRGLVYNRYFHEYIKGPGICSVLYYFSEGFIVYSLGP